MSVSSESSWRYAGWRVAGGSAVGVFAGFGSLLVFAFGIFLKPISAEFGWSRESVSAAFGVAALALAACSPVLGMLLDRVGARRVVIPCVIAFGLALASLALLPRKLGALYATFAALGAVGNGTAHLAYTRAVTSWFVEYRGRALALLMMGSGVGAMLWPPVSQGLIAMFGWRGAIAGLGVAALLLGLTVGLFFVRENPSGANRRVVAGRGNALAWQEALSRPFVVIIVILFLASLGQNGTVIHLSAMLTDRGLRAEDAALAVSALGAASLAGRLIAGYMLDRFFGPRVAMWLLAVAAAGAFVLSGAKTVGAAVLGAGLVGIGMGGEADITPYLLSRYFGLGSFSTLYGLSWSGYAVAGALGPVLMGRAFDLTGSYSTFLLGLAALMLGAAGLTVLLPRYTGPAAAVPGSIAGAEVSTQEV